jgi:L-rhamnose mutarotase
MGVGSACLAALNLLRLNSKTVKDWVNENWKGFLREENDEWPAVIALIAAVSISNYSTGLRYPFP